MAWQPPFDDCKDCQFFRRSKAMPICKFCTVGEFFTEKDRSIDTPDFNSLMRIYEKMDSAEADDRTPLESDAITIADENSHEPD